jgi:hypothetical protein
MRTSAERLQTLAGCGDAATLRSAVSELCTEFGKPTLVDIVTMAEARHRRALCFLRLETAAQERQLMAAVGASRMGEDLLLIVELPAS